METPKSLQETEIWMKSETEMRMDMRDRIVADKEIMKILKDLMENPRK